MKTPLRYQVSEYDCGPTTLLNALSYLFERERIPADMVRNINLYSLDTYTSDGKMGGYGTSYAAMNFISGWLNNAGKFQVLPIRAEYLTERQVTVGEESRVISAVKRNGVVVLRCLSEVWHYVLVTGWKDRQVFLFDPYYEDTSEDPDIQLVTDSPFCYNRIVPERFFNKEENTLYALGPWKEREAVLLFNTETEENMDNSIEYII